MNLLFFSGIVYNTSMNNENDNENSIQVKAVEGKKRHRTISLHFIVRSLGIVMVITALGLFGMIMHKHSLMSVILMKSLSCWM